MSAKVTARIRKARQTAAPIPSGRLRHPPRRNDHPISSDELLMPLSARDACVVEEERDVDVPRLRDNGRHVTA
eukprot:6214517-Pleurochrysis_carterae.AAC.2